VGCERSERLEPTTASIPFPTKFNGIR